MNTGQTLLAIGALVLLMTILLSFYSALARIGIPLEESQFGISATTLATTFIDMAHGLHFDENSAGQKITNTNQLTQASSLGPSSSLILLLPDWPLVPRDSLHLFRNFDDLKGAIIDTDLGELGIFRTEFDVYYVHPNDISTEVTSRQFTKRMDLSIYRVDTPAEADIESINTFTVMGYFKFN